MPKVAVIDCGVGNLFSIDCALRKVGLGVSICSEPRGLREVDAVVLPGVGNFKAGSGNLKVLRGDLVRMVGAEMPILGVCLGMQLLFEESEESPGQGLDLLKGRVLRLPKHVKTPHMGWNTLNISKPNTLLEGVNGNDYFYFVHSYFTSPLDEDVVLARTDYGLSFASVVAKMNVFGTQFHPEKSGKPGERVLHNFAKIIKG